MDNPLLLHLARPAAQLPREALVAARRLGFRPSRFILVVQVATQSMSVWESWGPSFSSRGTAPAAGDKLKLELQGRLLISTSRFGVGQAEDSQRTPLGLHRVAAKIGAGQPIGTVFRARRAVGLTWQGQPQAAIAHRILWLEGLEPGFNRGGRVDSFRRFIYIHGVGDETTLGRPSSRGCIHVAAANLLPLFDRVPVGTLVWITER
jgi:hypothetical protein